MSSAGALVLLLLSPTCLCFQPSSGCGKSLPVEARRGESHDVTLALSDPLQGAVSRSYLLHLPLHFPLSNSLALPLVLDYHGWGGTARSQEEDSQFSAVADEQEEEEGGFLLATGQGMGDVRGADGGIEPGWGSWNVSHSSGPLGDVCRTNRSAHGEIPCYSSCPSCSSGDSCDWTSCHDDVLYTEQLIDQVASLYCTDLDSVHLSGISNGGIFSFYFASRSNRLASIAPVAASPLLGFSQLPPSGLSLIDLHGLTDFTIPYSLAQASALGPHGSLEDTRDGFFYMDKSRLVEDWVEGWGCGQGEDWVEGWGCGQGEDWVEGWGCGQGEDWHTGWEGELGQHTTQDLADREGRQGWGCVVHRGCRDGGEIVTCTGDHGHDYPFGPGRHIEASRIMWQFMKTHPKK